jgi:hypothetical protein
MVIDDELVVRENKASGFKMANIQMKIPLETKRD